MRPNGIHACIYIACVTTKTHLEVFYMCVCSLVTVLMLRDVARQLLEETSLTYREHGSLTDDILSALHVVFQAPLLPAFDLVDHHKVTCLVSPSGRSVYQVIGSSGTSYTCLVTADYCGCLAYQFSVLKNKDQLMCKHLLAVHLSVAMGKCEEQSVTDEDIAFSLKHMGAVSD